MQAGTRTLHNHDTKETLMAITGRWRCAWNEGGAYEYVDVSPLDTASFPPGVARRFFNVTEGEPGTEHLMLFVIVGDTPQAAYTAGANQIMEEREKSQTDKR
jgi:hypothetical protein